MLPFPTHLPCLEFGSESINMTTNYIFVKIGSYTNLMEQIMHLVLIDLILSSTSNNDAINDRLQIFL